MCKFDSKTRKNANFLLLTFFLWVFLVNEVFACTCNEGILPPCVAYERADVVFIGKLEKIISTQEKREKSFTSVVEFRIERKIKGNVTNKVNVMMPIGDCGYSLEVNKEYFVYAYINETYDVLEVKPCSRTTQIHNANSDIEYTNGLNTFSSTQSIIGEIRGISSDDIKKVEVVVSDGKETSRVQIEENGGFSLQTSKIGKLQVSIIFPFEIEMYVLGNPQVDINTQNSHSVIKYEANLSKHQCDYRIIDAKKIDRLATASIKGRLVDVSGNPVSETKVYLYRNLSDINPYSVDYDLSETDSNGNFSFNRIKAGEYFVGLNIYKTPDFDTPFPQKLFENSKIVVEIEGRQTTN